MSVQFHAVGALSPEKDPLLLIVEEVGWAHSRYGGFGEEVSHLPLPGNKPRILGYSVRCVVTIYQLRPPNSLRQSYKIIKRLCDEMHPFLIL
jgi:hypothetical protein